MKRIKRTLTVCLSIVLLLSSLTSCLFVPKNIKPADTEPVDTQEIPDFTKPTVPKDTKPEKEEPPEPETTQSYKWILDPGTLKGEMRPIYNIMSNCPSSFGVNIFSDEDGEYIVGYDGEKRATLIGSQGHYEYTYCSICGMITDHSVGIDPTSYENVEGAFGHGGSNNAPYIYDKDTGKLYDMQYGEYFPIEFNYSGVVSVCVRRAATEDEKAFSGNDFAYDPAEGYGILKDGELKVKGYDMYTKFMCGVAALSKQGKWAYFDENGVEILPMEYSPSNTQKGYNELYEESYVPYQATYGVLALCKNGKWGYADVNGNMLTDFEFTAAMPVYKNRGWVETDKGWGLIELDYSYPQISANEFKNMLSNGYYTEEGVSSAQKIGEVKFYDTDFDKYLVNNRDIYYVASDGNFTNNFYSK